MGLLNLLTFSAGVVAGTQVGMRIASLRGPRPYPQQLAPLLDHPLRARYRPPLETVATLGLASGTQVLDLGCGTGLFTEEMARQVGPTGMVHAVDLQEAMLAKARAKIGTAGLGQRVDFHHSGAYRLPLKDGAVDVAVLISTLSEIPNKLLALAEIRRVLRPDGRLIVSEEMPHPGYVPSNMVRGWLRDGGFRYGGQIGNPFCYTLLYFVDDPDVAKPGVARPG